MQIESTHSVEITDFVDQAQINPKFFYKPYFLEPQKGGEKAYALLHKALTRSGKVGVAKVAIQKREYLAAVKPDGLFLILELMHFAQEVLEPASLNSGADQAVSPQELKMATALIDAMTTEWEPSKYKDQYQTALMQLIEEKAQKRPPRPSQPRRAFSLTSSIWSPSSNKACSAQVEAESIKRSNGLGEVDLGVGEAEEKVGRGLKPGSFHFPSSVRCGLDAKERRSRQPTCSESRDDACAPPWGEIVTVPH